MNNTFDKWWASDSWDAYLQALKTGPDPKLELIISRNSDHSLRYAQYVLNGPFPLGEPAIYINIFFSIQYSCLLKQRCLSIEKDMQKKLLPSPSHNFYYQIYTKDCLKLNHE